MAVIVPQGVLFRRASEGKIRRALIEEDLIEAVIGLPAKSIERSGVVAVLLILNKGKEKPRQGKVLFMDASQQVIEPTSLVAEKVLEPAELRRPGVMEKGQVDLLIREHLLVSKQRPLRAGHEESPRVVIGAVSVVSVRRRVDGVLQHSRVIGHIEEVIKASPWERHSQEKLTIASLILERLDVGSGGLPRSLHVRKNRRG